LLLINPMFGLKTNFLKPILSLSQGNRVAFPDNADERCEDNRGKGGGGYCQFMPEHVLAIADLANLVLCKQWGLVEACKFYSAQYLAIGTIILAPFGGPLLAYLAGHLGGSLGLWLGRAHVINETRAAAVREGFGKLAQLQMVSTFHEPCIDNNKVEHFVMEMLRQHRQTDEHSTGLCFWPEEVGHGYNYYPRADSPLSEYHAYITGVLANFLVRGQQVKVVKTLSSVSESEYLGEYGMCLQTNLQVKGTGLTVLPDTISPPHFGYDIVDLDGNWVHLDMIHQGFATKPSFFSLGDIEDGRRVEILKLPSPASLFLLVTRRYGRSPESVPEVFILQPWANQLKSACLQTPLVRLNNAIPLLPQLQGKHNGNLTYTFCEGPSFFAKVCKHLGCT